MEEGSRLFSEDRLDASWDFGFPSRFTEDSLEKVEVDWRRAMRPQAVVFLGRLS